MDIVRQSKSTITDFMAILSSILGALLQQQLLLLQISMKEERPIGFLRWLVGTRRLVETVIGQLAERFHIEKVRARDLWHQASRFWRKILAHTLCVKINLNLGNEPLQFERFLAC